MWMRRAMGWAKVLQRPLPNDTVKIVMRGVERRQDGGLKTGAI